MRTLLRVLFAFAAALPAGAQPSVSATSKKAALRAFEKEIARLNRIRYRYGDDLEKSMDSLEKAPRQMERLAARYAGNKERL